MLKKRAIPLIAIDKIRAKKKWREVLTRNLEIASKENISCFVISDEIYLFSLEEFEKAQKYYKKGYHKKMYSVKSPMELASFIKNLQKIHWKKDTEYVNDVEKYGVLYLANWKVVAKIKSAKKWAEQIKEVLGVEEK